MGAVSLQKASQKQATNQTAPKIFNYKLCKNTLAKAANSGTLEIGFEVHTCHMSCIFPESMNWI
jgi:hypothetical protein